MAPVRVLRAPPNPRLPPLPGPPVPDPPNPPNPPPSKVPPLPRAPWRRTDTKRSTRGAMVTLAAVDPDDPPKAGATATCCPTASADDEARVARTKRVPDV